MHARAFHCHEELEHILMCLAELGEARAVRLQYDYVEVVVADVAGSVLLLVRMTTASQLQHLYGG